MHIVLITAQDPVMRASKTAIRGSHYRVDTGPKIRTQWKTIPRIFIIVHNKFILIQYGAKGFFLISNFNELLHPNYHWSLLGKDADDSSGEIWHDTALHAGLHMNGEGATCIWKRWNKAWVFGLHATQFVYIIQNSISFQDGGQQKASSLYQN